MPPIVGKSLREIGLGDKAASVMLVLLEHGPMLAATVAKLAKLNRTTAYGILKELSGMGLVSSIKKEGATRWQSIAPEMLPGYIKRRRDALAQSERELAEAVPQMQLLRSKGATLPKIQYFEGTEGIIQAYQDTIDNNPSKKLWALTGLEAAYMRTDRTLVDYYPAARAKAGVEAWFVTPATEDAKKMTDLDAKVLRHSKFIPPEYNFDCEFTIYENKVGVYSYRKDNPIALIIEDETISHAMKQIYKFIESKAEDH
jgi:sugar-specific transcriptional regulator TrmB